MPSTASSGEPPPAIIGSVPPWLAFAVLFLLALLLRLIPGSSTPLHNDELHYAYDFMAAGETSSHAAIRDVSCAMVVERRTAHPALPTLLCRYLWFLPLGWMVDWTPTFLRGFNILCGVLLMVPAWATMRLIRGGGHGMAAALLVAVNPLLAWVSRTLYLDPIYTLFIALMIWAVAWSARRPGLSGPVLAGLACAAAVSCKISGPILLPALLAGLLLAPSSTPLTTRALRVAAGIAAAAGLFLLLNDPVQYLDRILQPTDPRYSEYILDGGMPERIFITIEHYGVIGFRDASITLLLALGVTIGLRGWRPSVPVLFLLFCLLCLTPLLVMHHVSLSGPHGFMPIAYALCLLATGFIDHPVRWVRMGMVGVHVLFCVVSIGLRAREISPGPDSPYLYPRKNPVYAVLSSHLHDRHRHPRMVFVGDGIRYSGMSASVRHAQLSEGAICFVPVVRWAPRDDFWDWAAFVVILKRDPRLVVPSQPEEAFSTLYEDDEFLVLERTSGAPRESIALDELEVADDPRAAEAGLVALRLPGDLIPFAGGVLLEGVPVPVVMHPGDAPPPALDGFLDLGNFGDALIYVDPSQDLSAVLTFSPPRIDQVFWGL